MAKKIYFKHVNTEVKETINTILDVTFANAFERKALSIELKQIEKELEDFKAQEENEGKSTVEFTKRMNVIKSKRDALRKWTDTTLRNHKNDDGVWEDGLFSAVGVTSNFCEIYLDCKANETWGKWDKTIKDMLVETYEISVEDKLLKKFADYLGRQVGSSCTGINQVLKGQLLKAQTVRNFSEIMVRAIAEYMAKTVEDVVIPTSEFYVAKINYDENLRTVVSYEVVAKTEEN